MKRQNQGDWIGFRQMRDQGTYEVGQGMAVRGDAEDVLELADGDEDAGGGYEPRNNRMRQKICKESKAQEAHCR